MSTAAPHNNNEEPGLHGTFRLSFVCVSRVECPPTCLTERACLWQQLCKSVCIVKLTLGLAIPPLRGAWPVAWRSRPDSQSKHANILTDASGANHVGEPRWGGLKPNKNKFETKAWIMGIEIVVVAVSRLLGWPSWDLCPGLISWTNHGSSNECKGSDASWSWCHSCKSSADANRCFKNKNNSEPSGRWTGRVWRKMSSNRIVPPDNIFEAVKLAPTHYITCVCGSVAHTHTHTHARFSTIPAVSCCEWPVTSNNVM